MPVISILESGLLFEPDAAPWFRFQDWPGFRPLKGLGISEMDFGFCPPATDEKWLLELRDYSITGNPSGLQNVESRKFLVAEFSQKAKDCLLVLGSLWHSLPQAAALSPCPVPQFATLPTPAARLKLVFVVKTDDPTTFQTVAQPLQDALRNRIAGQSELLGVRRACDILLLDHLTAIAHGLPLREAPPPSAGRPRPTARSRR